MKIQAVSAEYAHKVCGINNFGKDETFALPTKKTLYGVFENYGDTLRAFRILHILYGEMTSVLFVEVAGVGKMYIRTDNLWCYESKADYLNNKKTHIWAREGEYERDEFSIEDALYGYCDIKRMGYFEKPFHPIVYAWIGNKVEFSYCHVYFRYLVRENYVEVTYEPISIPFLKAKHYISEEDCINDNGLDVCEFDEPSQKYYDVEIEVIKTIKTRVRSTNVESVVRNAKVAFDKVENFKVFVDGELQYESK